MTLVYAKLDGPGYSRVRRGRGFCYIALSGKPLKRRSLIEYCRSLVIPPAWEDVWISPERNAHILSTGIDAARRKQYLYHPQWTKQRNARKFDDLLNFSSALPSVRQRVEKDMQAPRYSRRRVIASTVRLIDCGLIRVGNEQYTRSNGTRGATTLTTKSVEVAGTQVTLDFTGKAGQRRQLELDDPALARSIRYCQELPGQRLFQFVDVNDQRCDIDSADVNEYLKAATGEEFTAKHFRTWGGSVAACQYLFEHDHGEVSQAAGKRLESAMVKHVATVLGNTVSVARRFYVHPVVIEYAESCKPIEVGSRALTGLSRAESRLQRVLKQHRS